MSKRAPVTHYRHTRRFAAHVTVVAGILLASSLVKTGQNGQRPDCFRADKAA